MNKKKEAVKKNKKNKKKIKKIQKTSKTLYTDHGLTSFWPCLDPIDLNANFGLRSKLVLVS